jgi:hypothetical protein
MSSIKLDLSKVKHLKSDERSTTLRHADGHTIHLLHSALSPENQQQLSALSKIPQQAAQSVDKNMAEGGDVKKYGEHEGGHKRFYPSQNVKKNVTKLAYGGDAIRQAGASFKQATGATYGADPKPATTSQSHVSGDVRTPEQKSAAEHYYDTPKPSVTDQGPNTEPSSEMQTNGPGTQDRAPQGLAEGGKAELSGSGSPADPTSRLDQGFGKVIVKAEGGNVSKPENTLDYNKLRQEKRQMNSTEANKPVMPKKLADGGKVCHACGGAMMAKGGQVPRMMAEGTTNGPIDNAVPNYSDPNSANQQPTQQQLPDPQAEAMPKAQPNDKDAQLEAYKHNLPDVSRGMKFATPDNSQAAHMPGPNGEPPTAGYDVKAWQNAQNDVANAKEDNAAQIAGAQQQAIQQNQIRAQLGQPPLPVPNVPDGPQIPGSMENPPANTTNPIDPSGQKAQTAAAAGGTDPQDPYQMLQSGYQQQLQGIQGTSQAQQQQAQANSQVLQQAEQSKATALANYQGQYQDLEAERQNHIQDIRDGYIDPNKYWTGDAQGNGSHSKLAAGIGMILAGFNPTNKPNAAIEFLKYNMDKNMDAQVKNLGAKESMLSANLRQFGNLKDATDMTKLMQSDIVQNELQQAASKAATPMAKAAALTAAGQLKTEDAPKFQEFAMRRAMMNMANNGTGDDQSIQHMLGYMQAVNPKAAEEMRGRYVPGVGMASVNVPQDVRQQLVNGQTLQNTAQDVLNYSHTHTNIIPGTPEYNVGVQKAAILQQRIREGLLGTVFRESEKPLLNQFVDNNPAGAFKTISSDPKLRTILEANQAQMNTLKSNYGFPTDKGAAVQPQYKWRGGKKYQKGPNGEPQEVK